MEDRKLCERCGKNPWGCMTNQRIYICFDCMAAELNETEPRMKVRLFCNDKKAAEGTDATIRALPHGGSLKRGDGGEIEFDADGLATVIGGDQEFMRFALVRQGYVFEIVE